MSNHEHSHEHGPHEHPHVHGPTQPPPPDEAQFKVMWMRNFAPTLAVALLRRSEMAKYTPESLAAEVRAYLDALWQKMTL